MGLKLEKGSKQWVQHDPVWCDASLSVNTIRHQFQMRSQSQLERDNFSSSSSASGFTSDAFVYPWIIHKSYKLRAQALHLKREKMGLIAKVLFSKPVAINYKQFIT